MSLFNIDIDKLNLLLLPTMLRKKGLYGICKALSAPVRRIYKRFMAERENVLELLRYDASKYNIERYLNKRFGDGGKDIYIQNVTSQTALYLDFYLTEYLAMSGFYDDPSRAYLGEYLDFYIDPIEKSADFVVYIPTSLASVEDDIRSAVEQYALPALTFDIKTY